MRSTTQIVTSLDTFGAWTLGSALMYAQSGDVIDCTALRGTLNLQYVLYIHTNVTIKGPGSDLLTLDGGGQYQGFQIDAGLKVNISGLTIDHAGQSGNAGGAICVSGDADNVASPTQLNLDHVVLSNSNGTETGGGLSAASCTLTMNDCRVTGNTVHGSQDALGGGIYLTASTLNATGCTFDHNACVATGSLTTNGLADNAAMGGGLALMTAENAVLTNCTIAANTLDCDTGTSSAGATATTFGAGLLLAGDGDFTMNGCTVAGNTCSADHGADGFGGGVGVLSFGTETADGTDRFTLINSIVAGNTAAVGTDAFGLDVTASARSNIANNVFGVIDDSGATADSNVAGTLASPLDPGLGGLTDNGGPTPTMALQSGSPALGIAVNAPATDQRGLKRVAAFDAGAYDSDRDLVVMLDDTPLADATTDHWYNAVVTASTGSVAISVTNKPDWLTVIDRGDGTAQLTGTPSLADAGAQTVTLTLNDGSHTYQQTVNFAVDITPAAVVDGVLHVSGSDGNDTLHVWQPRGTGTAYRVAIGRRTRNYSFGEIHAIQMFGLGGDDVIIGNATDLGIWVDAGAGNDTVTGGVAPDTLLGGDGDDKLYGMGGNDQLDGGSGRDSLSGGDGNDYLHGGDGRDTLDGGLGRDVLYGDGSANFFISNDGARDYLFGGTTGQDSGTFDRRDVVADVLAYVAP